LPDAATGPRDQRSALGATRPGRDVRRSRSTDGDSMTTTDHSTNVELHARTRVPEGNPADVAVVVDREDRSSVLPAAVYLARLAPGSRRTMSGALRTIAAIVSSGELTAAELPWHRLRYEDTQAVRAVLAERYAPASVNKHLAALRGVLREAW